ncbi:Uncharacterised protein g1035 [Pycnogonum litorale]
MNPEENRKFLNEQEELMQEEFRIKYNFDVKSGKPIPGGRFQWKPVTVDSDEKSGCCSSDVNNKSGDFTDFGNDNCNVITERDGSREEEKSSDISSSSQVKTCRSKDIIEQQTKITDFLRKRKVITVVESSSSANKKPKK